MNKQTTSQQREIAIYSDRPHPRTNVSYIVGYELQTFRQDPSDGIFKIVDRKRVYFQTEGAARFSS